MFEQGIHFDLSIGLSSILRTKFARGFFCLKYVRRVFSTREISTQPDFRSAWIGSIQYAFTFFPSIITGRLFDLGVFKLPLFVASCLMVLATFLTAECKQYWQFLLCQGFVVGVSAFNYLLLLWVYEINCLDCLRSLFRTRHSGHLSLVQKAERLRARYDGMWLLTWRDKYALRLEGPQGSLLTLSIAIPIAFNKLVQEVGFPWTMRIIGFILICTLTVANLVSLFETLGSRTHTDCTYQTLQRRLPPMNVSGGLFNLRAFKNYAFSLYALSSFTAFLGLYTGQWLH